MDKAKNRTFFFFGCLIALLVVNFSLTFFGEGVCIASTPDEFNTRFSRRFMPKYCEGVKPCHVYLTLAEDVSTQMFVNFQTERWTTDNPMIYYDTESHNDVDSMDDMDEYDYKMSAKSYRSHNLDIDRGVHWGFLSNLNPNTVYYFRVGYGDSLDTYSDEKSFVTGPSTGKYNFIAGGDISVTDLSRQVSSHAAKKNPLFAALGGDIEYGNGFATCYWRLDHFLKNWGEDMVTEEGRMIPMMLSIGNHEAGGFFAGFSESSPYFTKWFPQSIDHDDPSSVTSEDQPHTRKTYHYHKISNTTSFYTLDSDVIHTTEPGSSQHNWFKESLEANTTNQQYKFAVYHAPLYPSYRPFDGSVSTDLRKNWLPLFDEYNMTVAFENHDHAYKKTKLMRGNKPDPTGTLYTGDGSWGVPVRPTDIASDKMWYMEKVTGKNYILSVEVFNSHLNISAIDEKGEVFDTYFHSISS